MPKRLSFWSSYSNIGIWAALILEILVLSLLTSSVDGDGFQSRFLSYSNIIQVLRAISFIALMVVGQSVILISGGIDLGVGSVLGFSGVVTALLLTNNVPLGASIFVGLAAGTATGIVNGIVITSAGVSPFIATLGMLSIARGLAYGITGGETVRNLPDTFLFIGQGSLLGVPIPVLLLAVFAVVISIFLKYTVWGRYAYAIGGNETAAVYGGISVDRMKILYYGICGFSAGLAGILYVSRFGVGQSTAGLGYELDVIAAAVIGGVSLAGGRGSIMGAMLGSIFMGILRNGLVLLDVSAYWQQVAIGSVIVLAVVIDTQRRKFAQSKLRR